MKLSRTRQELELKRRETGGGRRREGSRGLEGETIMAAKEHQILAMTEQ